MPCCYQRSPPNTALDGSHGSQEKSVRSPSFHIGQGCTSARSSICPTSMPNFLFSIPPSQEYSQPDCSPPTSLAASQEGTPKDWQFQIPLSEELRGTIEMGIFTCRTSPHQHCLHFKHNTILMSC